jgi:hypothetical protein
MSDDDARVELEILFANLSRAEERLNDGKLLDEKQRKEIKAAAGLRAQTSRTVPEQEAYGGGQSNRVRRRRYNPQTGTMEDVD